jgi:hypothetical protein
VPRAGEQIEGPGGFRLHFVTTGAESGGEHRRVLRPHLRGEAAALADQGEFAAFLDEFRDEIRF